MNTREIGAKKENVAAEYLQSQGMQILERNFRNRFGEIDLIGQDGEYLVFLEVKFRKNNSFGMPQEAVDARKQRKICKVADYYRMRKHLSDQTPVRYDVLSICGNEIEWIKNAFYHTY